MSARDAAAAVIPGPQEIFERWTNIEVAKWMERDPQRPGFSPETVPVYQSIWNLWLHWLASRPAEEFRDAHWRWLWATPQHVQGFLSRPAPVNRGRQAKKEDALANFTRQRYWSVLRDVYSLAVIEGHLLQNPAEAVLNKPVVERRSRVPQILPAGVLQLLRDARVLRELLPEGSGWWVHRDRAAVALLAHCGMSAGELIAMKGKDIRRGAGGALTAAPQELLTGFADAAPVHVDVGERSVPVPDAALPLVYAWLDVRHDLLARQRERAQAAAGAVGAAADAQALLRAPQQPLFLSREAKAGVHTQLDPSSLFVLVRRCLKAAYELPRVSARLTPGGYVATGPAIIRNSVIRTWAEEVGAAQAVAWAGLKSLDRLGQPVDAGA